MILCRNKPLSLYVIICLMVCYVKLCLHVMFMLCYAIYCANIVKQRYVSSPSIDASCIRHRAAEVVNYNYNITRPISSNVA